MNVLAQACAVAAQAEATAISQSGYVGPLLLWERKVGLLRAHYRPLAHREEFRALTAILDGVALAVFMGGVSLWAVDWLAMPFLWEYAAGTRVVVLFRYAEPATHPDGLRLRQATFVTLPLEGFGL